ncbi:MAG: endonuclease/exonuclease/phosphatase family protein [Chlamydiia bacterium]
MKPNLLSPLLLLLGLTNLGAIENSIIPQMNQCRQLSSLQLDKYPTALQEEIREALQHTGDCLRIATYNVLFSGHDDQLAWRDRWPQRLPRLVETIRNIDPDILAVQELLSEQLDDLQSLLKDCFNVYVPSAPYGELNCVFYRSDRLELLKGTTVILCDKPRLMSDSLTIVQLMDRQTGLPIALFNTHLPFHSIDWQVDHARKIADHLREAAQSMPTVFCGDLNTFATLLDRPTLPLYGGEYVERILSASGVQDARLHALVGHLGPLGTFTSHNDRRLKAKPFSGFGVPGVILDHIYVSASVHVLVHGIETATVGGEFGSDHMPVVIDCLVDTRFQVPGILSGEAAAMP